MTFYSISTLSYIRKSLLELDEYMASINYNVTLSTDS